MDDQPFIVRVKPIVGATENPVASSTTTVSYEFPRFVSQLSKDGPKHWRELHTQRNLTPEWFADWLSRIPNYGCSCRSEFKTILERIPVRYDDFFEWSVEVHNAVNEKLGKPIFELSEAMKRYERE